ncbi:hypothetical protein SVAN01_11045 [Stagonosporopsis vannaccii]|nr:hypothetical protein SVAN01_11045 [Stagonosporopsis vannaccii]
MRTKRKNVCQNCRAKKLACDGVQPACSQCLFKRICCSGYKQEFVFVSGTASNTRVRIQAVERKKLKPTGIVEVQRLGYAQPTGSALPQDTTNSISITQVSRFGIAQSSYNLEDDVRFIVEQYATNDTEELEDVCLPQNQICGAWVNILPLISRSRNGDQPLLSAIRTLAIALRHYNFKMNVCQSQILELYSESLRYMGSALEKAQGAFHIEHCAAIMCLADTDIINSKLKSGWMTHAKAVGDMMEGQGPISFGSGAMHTMFVGFRPLLLMGSILNRQGTFLARDEWTTKPFQGQPMSAMQLLLNRVCKLPALLERFCEVQNASGPSEFHTIQQLWRDFSALLTRLREWERQIQSFAPLVWTKTEPDIGSLPGVGALWFPNLMIANSMMHYWAFEIIIRIHLSTLDKMFLTTEDLHLEAKMTVDSEGVEEHSLLTLADMICDSTSYLLQTKFKFHGLWSAFFTLPTALRVYKQEPALSNTRTKRSKQIDNLLASRDIYFP